MDWTKITEASNEEAYTAYLHLWPYVSQYSGKPLLSDGIAVEAGGIAGLAIIRLSDEENGTTFYVTPQSGVVSDVIAKACSLLRKAEKSREEEAEIEAYNRSARQHRAYAGRRR